MGTSCRGTHRSHSSVRETAVGLALPCGLCVRPRVAWEQYSGPYSLNEPVQRWMSGFGVGTGRGDGEMTEWVFQANPKRYDLLGAARSGFDDNWSMNQHRGEVAVGDKVYFFVSGAAAGIYLVGRVVSPVYESAEMDDFGKWKVDVEYEAFVEPPLLRRELLDAQSEPILAAYDPFKGQQRTNFIVPSDVADRLAVVTEGRLAPIPRQPGQGFDKTAHAVDVAIKEHDAAVAERMLRLLKEMDPGDFEVLIQRLLERLGYEDAEVRGKTGDGGVDVYAVLRLHGMTAVPTVVQAKRWTSGNVSGKVIRELRGALHVDEHGVVVTTANFTPEAIAEAKAPGKAPIGTVDGPSLVRLLIENGIGVTTVSVPLRRLEPATLLAGHE